jgi:hypothetical protein
MDADANSAAACWTRFCEAAADARDGHFSKGHKLIARVRVRFGDYAAETARRELRAWCDREAREAEKINHRISPVFEVVDVPEFEEVD